MRGPLEPRCIVDPTAYQAHRDPVDLRAARFSMGAGAPPVVLKGNRTWHRGTRTGPKKSSASAGGYTKRPIESSMRNPPN